MGALSGNGVVGGSFSGPPVAASARRRRVHLRFVLHRRPAQVVPGKVPGLFMGKDQLQELLASVDPNLASPREQLRALGDGTWTFTVVVDRECRHGLDQLRSLLSHVDPAMSYGQLVNRLVQDELRRRDPRLRGSTGTDTRPGATGGPAAKRTTHAESAKHPGSNGAAAAKRAAATAGAPSASKREAQPVHDGPPAENGTSPEPAEAVSTAKCVAADGGAAPSKPNQTDPGDAGRRHPPGASSPPRSSGPCGSRMADGAHTSIRRSGDAAPPVICFRSTTSGPGRGEEGPSPTISDCSVMPIIGIAMGSCRSRERGRIDAPCRSECRIVVRQVPSNRDHGARKGDTL